jgi:transcriptional regulator with XRE-family HTH domain
MSIQSIAHHKENQLTNLFEAPFSATIDVSIGALVRKWRTLRKLSQMDLALDIDISPRHLSFVETGRAKPSVEVLMTIADHLDVPLRERNIWLLAAGYAPRYSEHGLDSVRMTQVKTALQRLLNAHHPYPGVALDRQWNVVLHNKAAENLMGLLPAALKFPSINIFKASLHPDGFAAYTKNFSEWGSYLLQVLQRLVLSARDESLMALADEVNRYPNVQALKQNIPGLMSAEPSLLVPCVLNIQSQELSLFTTLTTFGSPIDITLYELCIELFYPVDEKTARFLDEHA